MRGWDEGWRRKGRRKGREHPCEMRDRNQRAREIVRDDSLAIQEEERAEGREEDIQTPSSDFINSLNMVCFYLKKHNIKHVKFSYVSYQFISWTFKTSQKQILILHPTNYLYTLEAFLQTFRTHPHDFTNPN
jgi:hypothetical protein